MTNNELDTIKVILDEKIYNKFLEVDNILTWFLAQPPGPAMPPEGCLTYYIYEVFGGWNGKYPGFEKCVAVEVYYNPLRMTGTDARTEVARLIHAMCTELQYTPSFIPMYITASRVYNAKNIG